MIRDNRPNHEKEEPRYAPGLERDELDLEATPKEVKRGDYTKTTKLFLDRLDD